MLTDAGRLWVYWLRRACALHHAHACLWRCRRVTPTPCTLLPPVRCLRPFFRGASEPYAGNSPWWPTTCKARLAIALSVVKAGTGRESNPLPEDCAARRLTPISPPGSRCGHPPAGCSTGITRPSIQLLKWRKRASFPSWHPLSRSHQRLGLPTGVTGRWWPHTLTTDHW